MCPDGFGQFCDADFMGVIVKISQKCTGLENVDSGAVGMF